MKTPHGSCPSCGGYKWECDQCADHVNGVVITLDDFRIVAGALEWIQSNCDLAPPEKIEKLAADAVKLLLGENDD